MSKIHTDVVLTTKSNIPIEIIKDAEGWLEILLNNLPFIITALIVLAAATVTYRSNRKSVESQNALAGRAREAEHENKISEFRHQWLQEVRETVSTLCQIMHEMQQNIVERNIARDNLRQAIRNDDESSGNIFESQMQECFRRLVEQRSRFYLVSSKIKLLFKSSDPDTEEAFRLINSIKDDAYDFDKMHLEDDKIESLIKEFQVILKAEWEETKNRSWKVSLNK